MKVKRERQNVILRIIAATDVETQNHLIEELNKVGIVSTQATVSRDIKELHLVKELTPRNTYRYVASSKPETQNHSARLKSIFKESVTSYNYAQNIVVIKTLPGLAPAACGAIDAMGIKSLVGSIAGDDTGFLAMSDTPAAERFCKEIENMLK
jgi:transcriptional regulator of arginine metabolism